MSMSRAEDDEQKLEYNSLCVYKYTAHGNKEPLLKIS